MRLPALLLLAACAVPAFAADDAAPAADSKAQIREISSKLSTMRAQAIKDDPELAKLKVQADEARKAVDAAADEKLSANADYQALKAKLEELKPKPKEHKEKEKKEPKKKEKKEGQDGGAGGAQEGQE